MNINKIITEEINDSYLDDMGVKATIVVASHLSDATMEMSFKPELAKVRINFVKFIINKLNGNLSQGINPDKMFQDYIEYYGIDMNKINP